MSLRKVLLVPQFTSDFLTWIFHCRTKPTRFFHRLRYWIIKHESDRAMVTTASSLTSIYYWREVHETFHSMFFIIKRSHDNLPSCIQVSNHPSPTQATSSHPTPPADPKRPYGGLVPSQPKGQRAYQDAAAYNQHLVQHQVYTAQAQAASQASHAYRNPYVAQGSQPPQSSARYHPQAHADDSSVVTGHHNRSESQYNSVPQNMNQSATLKVSNLAPQTSTGKHLSYVCCAWHCILSRQ